MKKIMILSALLFSTLALHAQEEFLSGRPGFVEGTDKIQKGSIYWETGISYDRGIDEDNTKTKLIDFCNTVLRYALTNETELQLQFDGLSLHSDGYHTTGMGPVIAGFKSRLYTGGGWVPNVTLLTLFSLPIGSKDFRPDNIAPNLYAVFSNQLSEKLSLTYSPGLEWYGSDAGQTVYLGASLWHETTDRLSLYFESYNYFPRHYKADWNINGGLTYLVGPRVQLDLSANMNLNNFGREWGISAGVAWKIRGKK